MVVPPVEILDEKCGCPWACWASLGGPLNKSYLRRHRPPAPRDERLGESARQPLGVDSSRLAQQAAGFII
jgi:hypothetical protein